MWIMKGSLLGVLIFIVGAIIYGILRVLVVGFHLAHAAKNAAPGGAGSSWDIKGMLPAVLYNPYLWIAFLLRLVYGLLNESRRDDRCVGQAVGNGSGQWFRFRAARTP